MLKTQEYSSFNNTKKSAAIDEIRSANDLVEEFLYLEPMAAEEMTGFIPTRYELNEIVKYWYRMMLEHNWFFFLYENSNSIDHSRDEFAKARISGIAAVVGDEEVNKAIAETRAEFARFCGPEAWEAFHHAMKSNGPL